MPDNMDPLEMMDELIDIIFAVKDGRMPLDDVLAKAAQVREVWARDGIDFGAIKDVHIMDPTPPGLTETEAKLYLQLVLLVKAYGNALDIYFGPGMSEKSAILAESATMLKKMKEGHA